MQCDCEGPSDCPLAGVTTHHEWRLCSGRRGERLQRQYRERFRHGSDDAGDVATTAEAATAGALPCVHRRELVRKIKCKPCDGGEVPVYRCELHGECIIARRPGVRRIRACTGCEDRREAQFDVGYDRDATRSAGARGRGIQRVADGIVGGLQAAGWSVGSSSDRGRVRLTINHHVDVPAKHDDAIYASYLHDLIPWHRGASGEYRARQIRLRDYDVLFANSRYTADDFARHVGIDRNRIHVVYAGIDDAFDIFGNEPRRGVLHVGGRDPRKGTRELIDAYGRLPENLRQQHPLTISFQMDRQHEMQLRAIFGRDASINVEPNVTNARLAELYRSHAIMALPSKAEGLGLPIVEAISSGCRPVCGHNTAQAEAGGDLAEYCDASSSEAIADALHRALGRPGITRWAARDHTHPFQWRVVTQRIIDALEAVL